ncbi:MAG: hypothetical protein KZQ81_12420 [Candidatus Thiodiazotropha sp. (ex Rostrolucina anterorostrata)]|nr:hypothetical protein [Candidatus Thiodiazotropha sp. (ex Rostrolucina anterorostrata)]
MRYPSISLFSLFLSVMLLQGCGGGGGGDSDGPNTSVGTTYTGSTAEATIDASNAKEFSTGAASGTQQAVASDAVSGVAMRPQATPTTKLSELAPRIAQWIDQLRSPNAARTTDLTAEICDAGGRAVADTNEAETEGSITFTHCAMSDTEGGTVVINGTVTFSANTSGDSLNMVFRVTVTYIGESQAINMTLACSNISTSSVACSITSDFAGIDGRIYRIEDLSVSGSEISGFYVSMTFYDPDYGRVDVTTTQPLTYDCPTAVPGSGMLTLSGSSDTFATASFDSCSSYTVTVDGVGATYHW